MSTSTQVSAAVSVENPDLDVEVCYSCHRVYLANTMGMCSTCCVNLCQRNGCAGQCECDHISAAIEKGIVPQVA